MHGVAAYERAFKMLEDALAQSGGPWILGSDPTLADINLMPYAARLDYLGLLDLWIKDRSRVKAWWASAREWPSFKSGLHAVLVLELRPPELPTFKALLLLWPTWLSYAVSYLFIAIVWVNHHHLLRYATEATPRLMWFNFAHLFSVSLLPLSTAWMAVSKLAPQPVAFYAAVFFFVNATYMALIWELLERAPVKEVSPKERRVMRFRSIATLCVFGIAAVVAFKYPLVGLGMCIFCLIVYLKPEDIVP